MIGGPLPRNRHFGLEAGTTRDRRGHGVSRIGRMRIGPVCIVHGVSQDGEFGKRGMGPSSIATPSPIDASTHRRIDDD